MKYYSNYIFRIICLCMVLTACSEDTSSTYSYDANLISMIVADNANLSLLNVANKRTGAYELLLEKGPYTLLAPSDAAFSLAGYTASADVNTIGLSKLTKIMSYHVLDGVYDLNKLPFIFNQEIHAHDGGKLFVTRWIKGQDTIITVNGATVKPTLKKATNGNLQVIDHLLEPYLFDYLNDALSNESDLTLFYQAIHRTKFQQLLSQPGIYTIYAPDNAAMVAYGLSSLQLINEKSVDELEELVSYHIVPDRRFVYDYILTTTGTQTSETMLNGDNVSVILLKDQTTSGSYTGIKIQGIRNTSASNLTRENMLAGNGVLHIIDQVLLN